MRNKEWNEEWLEYIPFFIGCNYIREYIFPGEYNVKLYVMSTRFGRECPDSIDLETNGDELIIVDEPSFVMGSSGNDNNGTNEDILLLPNFFSPNSDEEKIFKYHEEGILENLKDEVQNDLFRSVDVSIYEFDIVIFNRYGKKVHEFRGHIRNWKGWD